MLLRTGGRLVALTALLSAGLVTGASAIAAAPTPSVAAPSLAPAAGVSAPPAPASIVRLSRQLQRAPVYRGPNALWSLDVARLRAVLPQQTYVAVLGAKDLPGAPPDEVPALLSNRLGQGGTFVVLVGRELYGASTLVPGKLTDELATARTALPPSGDATPALVALAQSLAGPGDAADPSPPARAGSPVGGVLLVVIFLGLLVGALALWWVLKRPARRRPPGRVAAAKMLLEIDAYGNIVRVVPASERSDTGS